MGEPRVPPLNHSETIVLINTHLALDEAALHLQNGARVGPQIAALGGDVAVLRGGGGAEVGHVDAAVVLARALLAHLGS